MSGIVYELWDDDTGNCIGMHDNEAAALAAVRDTIRRYGRAIALPLSLLASTDDDAIEVLAQGEALIRRAEEATPAPKYLGIGLYTIAEAARLIRARSDDLRRWLGLTTYKSRGTRYPRIPFVAREFPEHPELVTFRELMELRAIRALRRHEISMRVIREHAHALQQEWGTWYPFSSELFREKYRTYGGHLYATSGEGQVWHGPSGQQALADIVLPLLREIDFGTDGMAIRWHPLGQTRRVVVDPSRQFGQPIDDLSGVPTSVLYIATKINHKDTTATIAKWYGVSLAAVTDAREYEESLLNKLPNAA